MWAVVTVYKTFRSNLSTTHALLQSDFEQILEEAFFLILGCPPLALTYFYSEKYASHLA